jgi:glycosyltransferase involved in cell wall biosynthesis
MEIKNNQHNKPLRIALVTDAFKIGGGLEHIFQIIKGLPKFRFGIFARGGKAVSKFEKLVNAEIYPEGYHPKYITRFNPDLIHIHHLKPLLKFYANPLRKNRIPVIFTMHGVHLHKYEYLGGIKNKITSLMRFELEKYLLRKVNKIIAVSEGDRKFIQTKFSVNNIIVIPNGLDFDEFEHKRSTSIFETKKSYNLPQDAFLFLTVARFDFPKGYDILVEAISLLKAEMSIQNVKFVFVGAGSQFTQIKQLAIHFSVDDLILFTGEVAPVTSLMKACEAFILPSRWEGLPLTLLEAGYLRLPVIASDTYGNREIIRHEQTGLLFHNEDATQLSQLIQKILDGKFNLSAFANNLYSLIRSKYDLKQNLSLLKQLYQEMCNPVSRKDGKILVEN